MVSIRKEKKGNKSYYYLDHSVRENDKIIKKTLYLGDSLPKDIEVIKKKFFHDLYKARWWPILNQIKQRFIKENVSKPKSLKDKEKENFSIKFTYDTQRIEGSTLTLKETADFLERGITPKEKPISDLKESEAHQKVFLDILDNKKDLSLQLVLSWHLQLFKQTKLDIAGKVRKHSVGIARSKFVPPLSIEVDLLLKEFFSWYNKEKKKLHPVELAALVHLKFVTVHPFADGNGRISRLMMNCVLKNHNFPLLNIHYNNRNSYYNALERAQVKKEEHIFVQWFVRRYIKEYASQ
jgi:Fic family protein